jgi:hypothetical protein
MPTRRGTSWTSLGWTCACTSPTTREDLASHQHGLCPQTMYTKTMVLRTVSPNHAHQDTGSADCVPKPCTPRVWFRKLCPQAMHIKTLIPRDVSPNHAHQDADSAGCVPKPCTRSPFANPTRPPFRQDDTPPYSLLSHPLLSPIRQSLFLPSVNLLTPAHPLPPSQQAVKACPHSSYSRAAEACSNSSYGRVRNTPTCPLQATTTELSFIHQLLRRPPRSHPISKSPFSLIRTLGTTPLDMTMTIGSPNPRPSLPSLPSPCYTS